MAAAQTPQLVKFLAVGKLVKDASGAFAPGKHVLLCHMLADDSDRARDAYRTRVNDIMSKAAAKLPMGKRLCLMSDDPGTDYELQVQAEEVPDAEGVVIVFFVVTDPGFGKAQSIAKLLGEFKAALYEGGAPAVAGAGSNGLQGRMSSGLRGIINKFGTSKLAVAASKVDEVKAVMRDNVQLAMANVDKLEDMEEKSKELERESDQFKRGATSLDRSMRCKNWKLVALGVLLVVAVLAAIIYPLAT